MKKEKFIKCTLKQEIINRLSDECQIEVDSWRLTKRGVGQYRLEIRVRGYLSIDDLVFLEGQYGFVPIVCPLSNDMLELYSACVSEQCLVKMMEDFNG